MKTDPDENPKYDRNTDPALKGIAREHRVAAWPWELVRIVASRPVFAEWRRKRQEAQQSLFAFRPYNSTDEHSSIARGKEAFDGAFGGLRWLLNNEGVPLPVERGHWRDLPDAGKKYFASIAVKPSQSVCEINSPFDLRDSRPLLTTVYSCGQWNDESSSGEEAIYPIDQLRALIDASNASPTARVIIAIIDEDVSAEDARLKFSAELTRAREDRNDTHAGRAWDALLRGAHFYWIQKQIEAEGREFVLTPHVCEAAGIPYSADPTTFTKKRALTLREVERLEAALASVAPSEITTVFTSGDWVE